MPWPICLKKYTSRFMGSSVHSPFKSRLKWDFKYHISSLILDVQKAITRLLIFLKYSCNFSSYQDTKLLTGIGGSPGQKNCFRSFLYMPYPSSLKCGHTMLKSCYVKFHEHLRRGHILKYIGKISLANFQLKIYLVEENWVWMLEFGMHVATNMFQK